MCSWRILYSTVPILIGFYIIEYKRDILNLIRLQSNLSNSKDEQIDLLIYIPSARENLIKRDTIRNTWAQSLNFSSKVQLRFVLGEKACHIPMDYRQDEYACEEWELPAIDQVNQKTRHAISLIENHPKMSKNNVEEYDTKQNDNKNNNNGNNNNENEEYNSADTNSMVNEEKDEEEEDEGVYPVQRFEFTVHNDLLLRSLGVHEVCLKEGAVVRMLEATTSKEVASVKFEASSAITSKFKFKNIDPPYILPKGFKGIVVVESMAQGNTECTFKYWDFPWDSVFNTSGLIQFYDPPTIPHSTYHSEENWGRRPFIVGNFAYKIHETGKLKEKIKNRKNLFDELQLNISKEEAAIHQERDKHHDIMFVDVVDVYRNLPLKFLSFAKEMLDTDVRMVLKVDDDAYVDIGSVMALIKGVNYQDNVWMGRFRYNWPINSHGKWADPVYSAPIYPRFACGSGYVLTQSLFRWLGSNHDKLKLFQGEDVSMGIWLSAVRHRVIDDPLWQCESECISDMRSMPDLRPDLLQAHWSSKIKCNDPCGCD